MAPKGDDDRPKRVTTSIELLAASLDIFRRVAALRAARGDTFEAEGGAKRPMTVSALLRETLEKRIPALRKELRTSGIEPENGADE